MRDRLAASLRQAISAPMMRFGLILASAVFVLDQVSKYLILGPMSFSPMGCLEFGLGCRHIELTPVFDLSMVWNRGVSFGLLRADSDIGRWLLVLLSIAIAGLFFWWLRSATRRLTGWALGFVIGGALGNMIDRIRYGAVADFLDFNGLWFPWVFNVADVAINVGAGLLLLDFLLHGDKKEGAAKAVSPQSSPQNGQDQG
jgi:signal peptidase II